MKYLVIYIEIHVYFVVTPIPCGEGCHCYYIQDKGNVFNCSSRQRRILPDANDVPNITNWLDVSSNKLNFLCGGHPYLKTISALYLENNNISGICNGTLDILTKGKLEILNLSGNNFSRLPEHIENVTTLTKAWFAGNPFKCDCDMLSMRDWMESFNKSGTRVVQDYLHINCQNGYPIHALDAVQMGCFPKELTLWEKILLGVSATVTIGIVIAIIAINRRWNEVKWFMYLHFNILDKNDGKEDLENMEKDAIISYR